MTSDEMRLILLACLDGEGGSAAAIANGLCSPCRKLMLRGSRYEAAEQLLKRLEKRDIAVVVLLGQKPRISDKIAVTPTARRGADIIRTPIDCGSAVRLLKAGGARAYISRGSGSSDHEHIYYECLQARFNTVLLQVPTIAGISDINAFIGASDTLLGNFDRIPCLL